MKWSQLTEINAGLMDSLTYEYVAENMPVEYEARQKDKLRYRYYACVVYVPAVCRTDLTRMHMRITFAFSTVRRFCFSWLHHPQNCACTQFTLTRSNNIPAVYLLLSLVFFSRLPHSYKLVRGTGSLLLPRFCGA